MSIEREHYDGPITLLCDGPRCHELCETHCSDFPSALAKAKAHGWRPTLIANEWMHFCGECVAEGHHRA